MDFNFQVPDEEEAEESISKDEADPGLYSDTLRSASLLGEPEVLAEVVSPLSPAGASPSDLHGLVIQSLNGWALTKLCGP